MIIGIIGGGQLGLMMAEAAHRLNHEVIGLDPNEQCPLSVIAKEMIVAPYDDACAFKQLADACDVMTYEFENVALPLIHQYEAKIPQKAGALEYSRNRLTEKAFAESLNIPVPHYTKYNQDSTFVIPCIIKTATGGYDGKGQTIIHSDEDLNHLALDSNKTYIVEQLIPFDYEVSCIASRDTNGHISIQPIPINTHKDGILFQSDLTKTIPIEIKDQLVTHTTNILCALDYVGTLAVEYFVVNDTVLFNEFAPRPHNSGHFSIEGSTVSQFTNHILAITNQPVQEATLLQPCIMINLIGQNIRLINQFKNINNLFFHDYYKHPIKSGRKMGHVTLLDASKVALQTSLIQLIEAIQ